LDGILIIILLKSNLDRRWNVKPSDSQNIVINILLELKYIIINEIWFDKVFQGSGVLKFGIETILYIQTIFFIKKFEYLFLHLQIVVGEYLYMPTSYNLNNHIILMGLIRFKYDNGFFSE
jgi:hypothetical protein